MISWRPWLWSLIKTSCAPETIPAPDACTASTATLARLFATPLFATHKLLYKYKKYQCNNDSSKILDLSIQNVHSHFFLI